MSYKILNNILNSVKAHSPLMDYTDGGVLHLFSKCICEQDSDYTHFGITQDKKEKFIFCYSDGKSFSNLTKKNAIPLGIKEFAAELTSNYQLSQEKVKKYFLEAIEGPIRKYETARANIDARVAKMKKILEEELKD